LTRIGVPGYIIKHIYKTTPALSWNIPIFGGFFPSAQTFHARGSASWKTHGKGGDHGAVKRSGNGNRKKTVLYQAFEGSKYQKEGKHG
jgi:hypothetical protein